MEEKRRVEFKKNWILQVQSEMIYISGAINGLDSKSVGKEYMEEGQCAQKWGRMLVFVICGFI